MCCSGGAPANSALEDVLQLPNRTVPPRGLGVGRGHDLLFVPADGAVVAAADRHRHQVGPDRRSERRCATVLCGPFGNIGEPNVHGLADSIGGEVLQGVGGVASAAPTPESPSRHGTPPVGSSRRHRIATNR